MLPQENVDTLKLVLESFSCKAMIASSKSIVMFRCICSSVRPLCLSSVIVVLKKGFIRHRAEKVRSASQDITGIVLSIFNSVEMFGKSLLSHSFRASIGPSGNLHDS